MSEKQKKQTLQVQTDLLATVFESSPNILMLVDAEGRVEKINRTGSEFAGNSQEELIGLLGGEVFKCINSFNGKGCGRNPECADCPVRSRLMRSQHKGETILNEEGMLMVRRDGGMVPLNFLISTVQVKIEDETKVLVTIVDITERKRDEEALRQSELQYRTILLTALDGFCLIDPESERILDVNEAYCKMSGYSRDEILQLTIGDLEAIESQDEIRVRIQKILKSGENRFESIHKRKDGSIFQVEISVQNLRNDNGRIFAFIHDITARKEAEQALRTSEEQYRLLFDEMLSGFALHEIICDEKGQPVDYRFLAVNSSFEQLTGLNSKAIIGKTVLEVLPETEPFWIERYGKVALEGTTDQFEGFSVAIGKYYEARAFCPEPGKFAVMFHDVTEHKRVEEEVRKSNRTLEEAEQLVRLGHYEIDMATGEAVWSEEIFKIFGLDPDIGEPTVETYNDLIHPDDRSKVYVLYEESARTGIPFDLVYRIIRPDGDIRYVHSNARVTRDITGNSKLFGTFQDITELKQIELALQDSEALYHDLVETAQDLIWQCDHEGKYVYLNPAWEEVFGYQLEEMLGKPFTDFQSPDYARRDKGTFLQLMNGDSVSRYETLHLAKDGQELQLVFNAKAVRDQHGKVIGTRGTAYDITERKLAEKALHESEERYRQAVENSPNPIFSIDKEGNILTWNRACEKTFQYDQGIIGQHYHILLRNVEDELAVEMLLDKPRYGHSLSDIDMVYRCQDGRECIMVSRIYPLSNQQGEVQGYVFANTDITERKQAEIALQESADRYRAVVESQTEFIVRWKPDGTRTFVNEAYLRYYNITLEEALTTSFMSLIVEEDRSAVEQKMSRLVSGETESETDIHRVIRPDGSFGWQEWTDHALYDEQGNIFEFQSVGRDITERKLAEEAVRAKTAELEALFSISAHLRSAQSADAMLPLVLKEARRALHSDANAVILLDPDKKHFTYALSDGPLSINNSAQFNVANSISGLVLQTGQPYTTENLSTDPNTTTTLTGDDDLGPAIFVPVLSESEFIGVLLCARFKEGNSRPFSSSETQLLTAIGEMVGNALRRARLYDQALTRLQQVQALHSIDMAISANLDLSVILDVLLSQGAAQLDVDAASILLLNPHTHMLEFAAENGFRAKEIYLARLRLGEGLPGQAAMDRKIMQISNLSDGENLVRKYLLDEGFSSYLAAPLVAKGQLQGVLEIFNRKPIVFGEEQTSFVETMATQAAIAIDNSQLFSDLQRSNFDLEMAYDATIEGWSRALELRDQETEGHTLRVTDMTLRLAQAMGVRGDELTQIRRGALLHDIGKMGIPDRILLKPGKLDSEEWEIMKQHTVYAYEMLWPIEFLRKAIDIPHCHHERWDGTGYPRQLKGKQIPLSARVFAVADVMDALTKDRPYRKAWAEEKALEYITTNSGKHFDPRVVETFLELRNRDGE